MTEQEAIEALIRKLDRRATLGWQDEYRIGKPLYDRLKTELSAGSLTHNQHANALVALNRLRSVGDLSEVFRLVLSGLNHAHERVRTQASKLAIGLMRAEKWAPALYNESTLRCLKEAVARGLSGDAEKLARDLLEKGTSAVELK